MAGLSSHVEKKRDVRKQINHHLHMILTEFSYSLEDLEIYFSLFSNKENCYVSEKVTLAVITDSELQNDPKGAIFMDVGTLDQIRDLYLICHVIKKNTKSTGFGTNRYYTVESQIEDALLFIFLNISACFESKHASINFPGKFVRYMGSRMTQNLPKSPIFAPKMRLLD